MIWIIGHHILRTSQATYAKIVIERFEMNKSIFLFVLAAIFVVASA